ncbi:cation diffusion facilitator family transporter [Alloalcanivorax xenomutans]|mgnify:CR=1 FL=1|jgi:cobalt-zinc-cadmium efflux system protein|uniref:cation diffusion facilitator family transporter n=1 Tax=Alloalcanivorax xenomutans TaxID=1094342 RepID=UPI0003B88B1C|nr:cation diffusion facilitator family transporter [Alloalcanivorax xenomutans]ERS14196.1 cobalt transporter [Alcanivorax sp. PN-3]KYZ85425.1 cobalt transporter [Alcanivorax sp. KX64203]MBA4722290.1 cation transporter [Alcanivorax sp.]MCE7523441.1 cation diffusion facilitator family transporter [Alloalcanivorax xenomutans]PHS70904.1 MAG: cation transporter [Alcanivorax sp.]
MHAHHGHEHGHSHQAPASFGKAFVIAISLNVGFTVVEFIYGFLAQSSALMADAGHNLSDVLGLVVAWVGMLLARKIPDQRFTYGLRGSSILAALANAMFLMIACGAISWDAIRRLADPPEVSSMTVIVVAAIGILINAASAWLFVKGSKGDLNIRGAFLHLVADAAVSLGVVIAGVAILMTDWNWLDPVVSLLIVVVIVIGTWGLLRESLKLALNAVPAHIDLNEVEAWLRDQPGVLDIHDLHVWGMSTTESALTAHLVMPGGADDAFVDGVADELHHRFGIEHTTLQVERGDSEHVCVLHR